ncbi:Guanyl-specific ribonuclease Ms [Cladophialophora carrionii]|uniref:ribonuclease T1 n=1 Tax=Cladophialophora carrionii TaxID=86049 RepID=A0A1C1CET9_9EURO|nr:Guanyl-specific ribonuclease Ms [Cladophialophora carrionii]
MQLSQILAGVLIAVTPVLALPPGFPSTKSPASPSLWPREFSPFAKRQSCVETCANVCYWQSDIDAAVSRGFELLESGQTLGSGDYPHQYNNFEGFDFPVSGPWYEFPILSSFQVYSGGSPGADRVIFNGNGAYAAVITHNGASGDDFVACAP